MSEADPYTPINLGQKRKLYNECVKYGIDKDTPVTSIDIAGEDVEKLMEIDIACAKQDLQFVLNALTDEDMLYVSRTIKQSAWIITDKKYSTIINPEYLETQLLPKMTAKAGTKLLKHIRLHLKDESRVEAFYKSEKNMKKALKWLLHCSVPFIEQEVTKHVGAIEIHFLKRLSEKSTSIWKIVMKHKDVQNKKRALQSTLFILYKDTEQYMDILEEAENYDLPKLGAKGTQVIMNGHSQRVFNKLQVYLQIIHIPTFAKCLKAEEVKDVLYKIADTYSKNNKRYYFYNFVFKLPNLNYFIQQMPVNQRYKFVKDVFIEKIHKNKIEAVSDEYSEINKMAKLYSMFESYSNDDTDYFWYQYAPFEEALAALKECIRNETSQYSRNSILKILLDCAGSNIKYLKEFLQYFNDKHINDKLIDKEDFIDQLLSSRNPIHNYEESTWHLLNEIFKSIDVYKESTDVSANIIEAIIVYNVIKNEKVPENIEKKFKFNTLRIYGNRMNKADKDKLFTYLYNYSFVKFKKFDVDNENDFKDKVNLLHVVLLTLENWGKDLGDYPIILEKIRECIQLKSKHTWKTNLSKLYNVKKTWKKYMFEESVILNPCEEVCLNALKHDAGLLKRNEEEMLKLSRNDNVSLSRLLSKIRIFWCETLAKEWANEYLSRLSQDGGLQALVRGLCAILPHSQLLDIIKSNAPEKSEISWGSEERTEEETDSIKIGLQRHIAKNMHKARPQPPPDSIFLYAKGDYLQYALPSILSIFYNLSERKTREYIPRLFDAPVSLQKHGLRLAVTKMQHQDVIDTFNNIWKTTKNVTIRAVIFKLTFTLLSKETDTVKIKQVWDFFTTIIDNLSFKEDSTIYETLGKVDQVPISVRAQYAERSYMFLTKMLPSTSDDERKKLETNMKSILLIVEDIMDLMCPKFVTKLLLEFIEELDVKPLDQILHKNMKIKLLSTYLLVNNTVESQNDKFNTVCKQFIKCSLKPSHKTFLPRMQFFLRQRLVKKIQDGMVIPEKMFSQLYSESNIVLPVTENYVLLTEMKLFVALLEILNKIEKDDLKKMMNIAASKFGKVCLTYLQEDIHAHFPLIYILFSKALNNVYESLKSLEETNMSIRNCLCSSILENKDFIPAYLVVLNIYLSNVNNTLSDHQKSENKALLELILQNESVEARMHYNRKILLKK